MSRHRRESPRRQREELLGSTTSRREDCALLLNENNGGRSQIRRGTRRCRDAALQSAMEQKARDFADGGAELYAKA
jgi:hypothetical protein